MNYIKDYVVKLEKENYEKLMYIAKYDYRTKNGIFVYLVNKCISDFEQEYGKIQLPIKSNKKSG